MENSPTSPGRHLSLRAPLLFEHPLNERTRTLLRISRLFEQIDSQREQQTPWQSRSALQALLDIATILARADIKTEMIKQLDQHAKSLEKVATNPDVDQDRLQRVLDDIDHTAHRLHGVTGQLGSRLRKNEFLAGIAQRMTIPGGSFEFDLPQFHYWLHLPHHQREEQLDQWLDEISVVRDAVELLLGLLRHGTLPRDQLARSGNFQKSLDPQRPVELVQVSLDPALGLFPEISGSKHRLNIRFMSCSDWEHPTATRQDVPFTLKTCVI